MENHGYSSIIGSSAAPYVNSLLPSAALAANYYAVTHPSLPNYLALAGGSMFGITSDCTTCWISATNIADRLEAAGSTWKGYMESMPSPCFIGDSYPYAQKHNPFIYFNDIRTNAVRCQSHVVPYSQLATDLASTATTPNFAFITPNMCSDTHDCTVGAGDSWLSVQVPSILNSAAFKTQRSLLLLTWDEDDSTGANQVATVLLGSGVAAGGRSSVAYNHYSLLRTIEAARGLTTLTANDANAAPITDLFATAPPPSPSPSPSPSPTPPPKPGVCSVVAISALPAAPSVAGAQVAATAAAGGCPSPRYEFWMRSSSGPWQMVQAYSGSATFSWSTSGLFADTYYFGVWAKDAGSPTSSFDINAAATYRLNPASCAAVSVSASPPSAAHSNLTQVTFTATASGCTHPSPLYEFWYFNGSAWFVVRGWSTTQTWVWNTSAPAGTYTFGVWVRDAASPGLHDGGSIGRFDTYAGVRYSLS